jgi:hypothetical protein
MNPVYGNTFQNVKKSRNKIPRIHLDILCWHIIFRKKEHFRSCVLCFNIKCLDIHAVFFPNFYVIFKFKFYASYIICSRVPMIETSHPDGEIIGSSFSISLSCCSYVSKLLLKSLHQLLLEVTDRIRICGCC